MLLLLPLLFSSSLVAAAPRHPRDVAKAHTTTTVTITTVVNTVYETLNVTPTSSTPTVVPEVGNVTSDAGYISSQSQPTGTKPSSAVNNETILPESNKATTKADGDTLERMSDSQVKAIYKTCWNGALQWPIPNTLNPVVDVVAPQLSIFALPAAKPNTLTVHNYCSYKVYFNHFNGANNLESGRIDAGATIDRPLAGTVMKVSKTSDMAKDMLIEYAVAGDGRLYYDLSLITCVENGDKTACAGQEAGLQLGNSNAKSFQCAPEKWCDDQAYLYQENLCKKQNPVSSCSPSDGLTMELCASQKR